MVKQTTKLQRELRESYNHNLFYKGFDNAKDVEGAFKIAGKRISYERKFNELKDYLSTKDLTETDKSVIVSEILNPISSYMGINARKLKNIHNVYDSVADIYENLAPKQETRQEEKSNLEFKTDGWYNTVKKAAAVTLVAGTLAVGAYLTGCGNDVKQEPRTQVKQEQVTMTDYRNLKAENVKKQAQLDSLVERVVDLEEKLDANGRPDAEVIAETTAKVTKELTSKYDAQLKDYNSKMDQLKDYIIKNAKVETKQIVETKPVQKTLETKVEEKKVDNEATWQDIEKIAERVNAKVENKDNNANESNILADSYNSTVKVIENGTNYVVGNVKDGTDATLNGVKTAWNYTADASVKSWEFSVGVGEKAKEYSVIAADFTQKDLGTYADHVIARNAQSDGKEVSINPAKLGNHVLGNFKPLVDDVTTADDLGYDLDNISKRNDSAIDGLKRAGNGLGKILTLGFMDFNTDEVKTKQGNQALRTALGLYDMPLGLFQATTKWLDVPTAGVTGKTVNVLTHGLEGTVNSAVDGGNYVLAVPAKGAQELEILGFNNNGKVSQVTYDALSTVARFGGNVILHETPRSGKTIRIVDKEGNYKDVSKGEIGATLELLTCLGLDTMIISNGFGGGSGSGNGGFGGGSGGGGSGGAPGGGGGPL